MINTKTHEIISISCDVCGAGKYCEEVRSGFNFWWLKALAERGNAALMQVRNCSECRDNLLLEERSTTLCLAEEGRHAKRLSLLSMKSTPLCQILRLTSTGAVTLMFGGDRLIISFRSELPDTQFNNHL